MTVMRPHDDGHPTNEPHRCVQRAGSFLPTAGAVPVDGGRRLADEDSGKSPRRTIVRLDEASRPPQRSGLLPATMRVVVATNGLVIDDGPCRPADEGHGRARRHPFVHRDEPVRTSRRARSYRATTPVVCDNDAPRCSEGARDAVPWRSSPREGRPQCREERAPSARERSACRCMTVVPPMHDARSPGKSAGHPRA